MKKYTNLVPTFLLILFLIASAEIQATNPNRFSRAFSHLNLLPHSHSEQKVPNKSSSSRISSPRFLSRGNKKLDYNKTFSLSEADTRGSKSKFKPVTN